MGLFQLMALLWLKEEMQRGASAAGDDAVEGSYFAHAIQTDVSPVYGTVRLTLHLQRVVASWRLLLTAGARRYY
jgi:hypothetical protein